MPTDPLKLLNDILEKKSQDVKRSFKGTSFHALIELNRCIDYFFINASYKVPREGIRKQDWLNRFKLFSIGGYEAFDLFMDEEAPGDALIRLPTNKKLRAWAIKSLNTLGNIGVIKRHISLTEAKVFQCEFDGKDSFTFKTFVTDAGIEYLEAQSQRWLLMYHLSIADYSHQYNWGPQVERDLRDNLEFKAPAFIQYKPTNLLERYGYLEGQRVIQSKIGYDYYPHDVKFGGIPFGNYLEVVIHLVGDSHMHQDFCLETRKVAELAHLDLWNLYPYYVRYENLIDSLARRTGFLKADIQKILEKITLDKKKLRDIYFPPGYAPPVLLKLSENYLLITQTGLQSNPLTYLNRCLRAAYPDDYFKAVNLREKLFQTELYSLFAKQIVTIPHSVGLKHLTKIYTDIDAVLYDKKDKILILVQQKFREDWATDMKQRSNMLENFEKELKTWMEALDNFIADHGEDMLVKKLSRKAIKPGAKIYRLVVGKHFSKFSNGRTYPGLLTANWATLVKTMVGSPQASASLTLFLEELEKNSVKAELPELHSGTMETGFKIGKYKFKIEYKSTKL
ncbi:hypothetical protein [Mucilaginibacter gossypii]|uniref:Uncharacterized protein n=1 Tax=Mucilaginibacter gossypii TaxID=551996 RepID=A0A1G8CYF0_9SPHI|nr:hypothetical protein [Mucilaginibacter gossypii]SDH50139.1 hypothetical protein SAMN05192573_11066 [Mucilaginibacter gossypii]